MKYEIGNERSAEVEELELDGGAASAKIEAGRVWGRLGYVLGLQAWNMILNWMWSLKLEGWRMWEGRQKSEKKKRKKKQSKNFRGSAAVTQRNLNWDSFNLFYSPAHFSLPFNTPSTSIPHSPHPSPAHLASPVSSAFLSLFPSISQLPHPCFSLPMQTATHTDLTHNSWTRAKLSQSLLDLPHSTTSYLSCHQLQWQCWIWFCSAGKFSLGTVERGTGGRMG